MLGLLPKVLFLSAGAAEGGSRLNSFDNALLAAGLADLNLLKVSSIAPPGAVLVDPFEIPRGSLVPTVYAQCVGETPGETIGAAIAVGFAADEGEAGIIMEHSGKMSAAAAEAAAREMLAEAFTNRGRRLGRVEAISAEHRVERIGCALAAAVLWI